MPNLKLSVDGIAYTALTSSVPVFTNQKLFRQGASGLK